jgi:hypothetical protein
VTPLLGEFLLPGHGAKPLRLANSRKSIAGAVHPEHALKIKRKKLLLLTINQKKLLIILLLTIILNMH